jgi:hypothetical protein
MRNYTPQNIRRVRSAYASFRRTLDATDRELRRDIFEQACSALTMNEKVRLVRRIVRGSRR